MALEVLREEAGGVVAGGDAASGGPRVPEASHKQVGTQAKQSPKPKSSPSKAGGEASDHMKRL